MARRRSHILRLATCAVLIVATAACGGDSRPTTPVSPTPLSPQPQIPNVAGTYQGPLTITAALWSIFTPPFSEELKTAVRNPNWHRSAFSAV